MHESGIQITRDTNDQGKLRSYSVYVDGNKASTIKVGQSVVIPVVPGKHIVQARIDWLRSNGMQVDITPGQALLLQVGAKGPNAKIFGLTILISAVGTALSLILGTWVGAVVAYAVAGLIYGIKAGRPTVRQVTSPNEVAA